MNQGRKNRDRLCWEGCKTDPWLASGSLCPHHCQSWSTPTTESHDGWVADVMLQYTTSISTLHVLLCLQKYASVFFPVTGHTRTMGTITTEKASAHCWELVEARGDLNRLLTRWQGSTSGAPAKLGRGKSFLPCALRELQSLPPKDLELSRKDTTVYPWNVVAGLVNSTLLNTH